jgi:hypothetical protein
MNMKGSSGPFVSVCARNMTYVWRRGEKREGGIVYDIHANDGGTGKFVNYDPNICVRNISNDSVNEISAQNCELLAVG